ncbi:MAG: recombinase family protein [Thermodesulfobacteriota bacterium]
MKYFLYARKSTDVEDKQVMSIEAQLAELRALAEKENLTISEEFVEKRTAKMPGRPIFNEMVKRIQKGEAQGIICWKLDRLARNPVDGGQISWMLQQGIVQHLLIHDRSYYPTDNVLMMSVEFGMANQFIRDLSTNVKRGLRAKVKRGEFPSTAPAGYLNDTRRRTIVVDRKKAPIITKAFELYADGEQRLEDISNFLYENGVRSSGAKKLHKDRIKWILQNPFYYGHFYYGGEIHEGKHHPIISKKLFDKVQEVILERGHPQKPRTNPKAFCGLLKCATCNMSITAELQKGHTYYRCTRKSRTAQCAEPFVREESILEQVNEILNNYSIPSPWAIEFKKLMKEDEVKAGEESKVLINDLRTRISDINEKIQRLLDVYLAQDIDRETYLRERSKLFSDKKSFEEKIMNLEKDTKAWLEPMQEWLNVASSLALAAQSNDLPSKKSSLQKIFGSNPTLHDRRILESVTPPYTALRAARQKFGPSEVSFIRATLYYQIRTYFRLLN